MQEEEQDSKRPPEHLYSCLSTIKKYTGLQLRRNDKATRSGSRWRVRVGMNGSLLFGSPFGWVIAGIRVFGYLHRADRIGPWRARPNPHCNASRLIGPAWFTSQRSQVSTISMALSPSRLFASSSRTIFSPSRVRRVALFLRPTGGRGFATEAEKFDPRTVEREKDEVDVCIVGGGPAGLSAAIRLKQLEAEKGGDELRVVVLEKGGEIGSHILSGAVIETRALDELLPDWKENGAPLNQPATSDSMRFLTSSSSFPMPHPPQMNNKGNYIVSLSRFTSWLGEQAEALGVEVYPGFAGARALYSEDGSGVVGVCTGDVGLDKNGQPKDSFEPGMEFHAKVTLIAEGAHGSLSKQLQKKFNLRDGVDPQTYGLGVKEVWKVRDEVYEPGKIVHTLGWPMDYKTYGGSWLYHMEDNMVSLGLVVGLDYQNPYLSPYKEFQVSLCPRRKLSPHHEE